MKNYHNFQKKLVYSSESTVMMRRMELVSKYIGQIFNYFLWLSFNVIILLLFCVFSFGEVLTDIV